MNKRLHTYWSSSSAPTPSKLSKLILKLGFIAGIALTVMFGIFWFDGSHIGSSFSLYVVFSFVFWYSILRVLYTWYIYTQIEKPVLPAKTKDKSVAIFTTSYRGEPLAMVEETLKACAKVTYQHTTYLLDDTDDLAYKATAEKHGAVWLNMRGVQGAKAGKVNRALAQTEEEFILILDPDHQPFPEFFDHTLGYFDDENVGFVQVSQGYYNQHRSFVAKSAAEQTYMFYGPVQMAYSQMGAAVAIGANCTFRRKAFDSIGGHVVGLAEDLLTSLAIHAAGWKSVYNPVIANRGIVPEDFDAFAKQQLKWARGAMDILVTDLPRVFGKLTGMQKLIYASIGTFYLDGLVSFFFILFPFIYLFTGATPVQMPWAQFLFFAGLYLIIGSIEYIVAIQYVCHPMERYFHWRAALLKYACWPVFLYAFFLTIFRKKVPYIPTAKVVGTQWPKFARPHWIYIILFGASIAGAMIYRYINKQNEVSNFDPTLWWIMIAFATVTAIMSGIAIMSLRPPKHLIGKSDPWIEISEL